MTPSSLKKLARSLFFALGLLLVYSLIRKVGAEELWETLRKIGLNLTYILILPLFWYFFQAIAWHLTLEETGTHVSLFQLLKIKLIGEAVNTLTPAGFMGGDPIRISILHKTMPGTLSTASVILDRTVQTLSVVVLLVISLLAAFMVLSLPPAWKIIFPGITLALIGLLWFLIHFQRKGIFEPLVHLLRRLGIKHRFLDTAQEQIVNLDERISSFYRHSPKRFLSVLTCHLLGRLLGVVEIYLIAQFLLIPLPWLGALFMATLTVLINILFVFIPGSLGVLEGAYGALAALMGLAPVSGVAVQLVRRIRSFFWISLGVLLMLIYSSSSLLKSLFKKERDF